MTYSSKSTAIRGFRRLHQVLAEGLSNQQIAEQFIRTDAEGKFTIELPATVTVKTRIYKGVQLRRRSLEPEGITSAVHEMFDEYQAEAEEAGRTLKRKDYIAKAVRDGVAYYTARTQYQKWLRG